MSNDYYTIQIHYDNSTKPLIEERKDCQPKEGQKLNDWMNEVRNRIYTTGFTKQESPIAFRLVSPLMVVNVFIIKQDAKFAL